ncbi:PREDICTED: uncharacterized protein LOC109212336 [Nicotiana attenuata]|uniref:uncharacterized protein LOC109212336 n=1 Tax=Nicotiana attenuata TaxID=49451 RepID=UPI0009052A06|nr:PREDICTED: uncharacterized protein LOC109212336 [Nicotiana attenuata]
MIHGCSESTTEFEDKAWSLVEENVKQDLLLSFQRVKYEMEAAYDMAKVKPALVARFGKILFYGSSSICQESLKSNPFGESTFTQMKKTLYTNIPPSYVEFMENLVVEELGLEYVQEKELYYLALVDKLLPDSTISCKCVVAKDLKKIQLHKIELSPVRHMVVDMSCVGKSLDLRLLLCTKKIIALSDEETNGIKDLVGSAILDPDVKGGLRWPFGKDSSVCRYDVIRVDHTIAKSYRNQSIRFKLRHADRFDFRYSTGEVAREIFLKMPGIISQLRKQTVEENVLLKMLEENLKLIWNHCLLDGSSS